MMNKQEILRKHLGQTPAEFQDLGKKNTLDAMEEYAELYHQSKVKTLGLFSASSGTLYDCDECIIYPCSLQEWSRDKDRKLKLNECGDKVVVNLDIQRVMRCASCEHKIDLVKAEKMQRYDELEHKYIKALHCDRCGHGHDNWKVE